MKLAAKIFPAILAMNLLIAIESTASIPSQPSQDKKKTDDQETVKLGATLVQVPAIVTDKSGRFVTDLAQGDFAVFEDGKKQEISLFTAVKQPFNAVLVLDTSNSAQDRLRAIQLAAVGFTREVTPADRMMVISFDNEVRQLTDFTSNQKELEKAILETESGFGKLLYEAVTRGLEQLRGVEGRRAVILFSDGVDMKSIEASAESASRLAEEIGAVIYVVKFDTRWWIEAEARKQQANESKSNLPFHVDGRIPLPPEFGGPEVNNPEIPAPRRPQIEVGPGDGRSRREPRITRIDEMGNRTTINPEPPDPLTENLDKLYGEADSFMKTVTSRTGGRVFDASTFNLTRSAFASIADELRNQYLLGYYTSTPHRDGKFHKIRLEVSRKGLLVRSRSGYRAAEQ